MNKTTTQKVEEVVERFDLKCMSFRSEKGFITDGGLSVHLQNEWLKQELTSLLNQRDAEVIELIKEQNN